MGRFVRKIQPHLFSGPRYAGQRIGILGGSFNPAHAGHVHISLLALKNMRLHQVWWLVSPQNPLKTSDDMATFQVRFDSAQKIIAAHPRLVVVDLETQLGTIYTADTLKKLQARFPRAHFVWMMGADNLLQIPRWRDWQKIFTSCDVAAYRRPPYAVGCTRGLAATRFWRTRIAPEKAPALARGVKKCWILFNNQWNGLSATRIRQTLKKDKSRG